MSPHDELVSFIENNWVVVEIGWSTVGALFVKWIQYKVWIIVDHICSSYWWDDASQFTGHTFIIDEDEMLHRKVYNIKDVSGCTFSTQFAVHKYSKLSDLGSTSNSMFASNMAYNLMLLACFFVHVALSSKVEQAQPYNSTQLDTSKLRLPWPQL